MQAVVSHAAGHGWPGHAVLLSAVVARYLETGGHYTEAVTIHTHTRRAARQLGDRGGEAHALNNLGIVSGRLEVAGTYLALALALSRGIGDRSGEASALTDLGVLACSRGQYQEATIRHRHALALFREIGERTGQAEALNGLGEVLLATGRPALARERHLAALSLASEVGDPHEQSRARLGADRCDLAELDVVR